MIAPATDLREFSGLDIGIGITSRAQKIPWDRAECPGRSRWLEFPGQSTGEERAVSRDGTIGLINLLKVTAILKKKKELKNQKNSKSQDHLYQPRTKTAENNNRQELEDKREIFFKKMEIKMC